VPITTKNQSSKEVIDFKSNVTSNNVDVYD